MGCEWSQHSPVGPARGLEDDPAVAAVVARDRALTLIPVVDQSGCRVDRQPAELNTTEQSRRGPMGCKFFLRGKAPH